VLRDVMSVHSGDIHDQIRNLSEISLFCSPKFCCGWSFQKLYPHNDTCLAYIT